MLVKYLLWSTDKNKKISEKSNHTIDGNNFNGYIAVSPTLILIAKKLEISLQLDYRIKRQTDFKELIRTSHQCALIGRQKRW
jgi:hypothetical protein